MSLPISTEQLLSTAIYSALSAALTTAGYTNAGPYYQLAPQRTAYPYAIFQYQVVSALDFVGERSGEVTVIIKGVATTPSQARAVASAAANAMASLSSVGYTVKAYYESSPQLPSDGNVWQIAHQFNVRIQPA